MPQSNQEEGAVGASLNDLRNKVAALEVLLSESVKVVQGNTLALRGAVEHIEKLEEALKKAAEAEVTRQREALADALEAMCKWIGPPPVDRYSFDSAREDAWKGSRAALRLAGRRP